MTTEPRTLTPEETAILHEALVVHTANAANTDEQGQVRALRRLLNSGRITVTPYKC